MSVAINTSKKISIRFKHYIQETNTVWESFEVINYYSNVLHEAIKNDIVSLPHVQTLSIDATRKKRIYSKERVYGTLSHIRDKKNLRTALIEATLIFEDYITDIVMLVYSDYPQKALSADLQNENQEKISNIILSSKDKAEIIDRLLEEKIRGLFYGNIADIFQKDRAKLELKDTFKTKEGLILIDSLLEILARRNIYIHNNGRVDRKYTRESKNPKAVLGSILVTDEQYIRNTINILSQIATLFTTAVLKNIYNTDPKSIALKRTYWHC